MALPRPPERASKARLMRDIKGMIECNQENVGISYHIGDNMREFQCTITGPTNTPYEKAKYQLKVQVPTTYPYKPPIIRFVTKIWHPNVGSRNGSICVDILNEKWTPSMDLRTTILSIQNLLENPEPNSPQDIIVGRQMRETPEVYQRTARVWAKVYGIGTEAEGDEEYNRKLQLVVDMGVWMGDALKMLSESGMLKVQCGL